MNRARLPSLGREIWASALAQRTQSLLTLLVAAAMTLTVMMTVGATVGAREQIVAGIDDAGTRTIVVRAQDGSGLTTDVLRRLEPLEGIEWSGAFGPAEDLRPRGLTGATPVPRRALSTADWGLLGIEPGEAVTDEDAWATADAVEQLGFADGVGAADTDHGVQAVIRGPVRLPEHLGFLGPVVLAPAAPAQDEQPVSVLVLVASGPEHVGPLVDALPGLMALEDPTKAELSTSEAFADLRGSIDAQLSSFSRTLLLLTFGSGALLVAITQCASVMVRRKDYGRRRALGAGQGLIVALVTGQTILVTLVGAALGVVGAAVALPLLGSPAPGPAFGAALTVLTVASAGIAGLIPAVLAARRDPLTELRVP